MDKNDIEFQKRINATFRIEAEEHLNAFSSGLVRLEKTHEEGKLAEIIETMFREIHSLKGAARSVDRKDVELICQPLESIFSLLKQKKTDLSVTSYDLFYKTLDRLSKLIIESDSVQTQVSMQSNRKLIGQLKRITEEVLNKSEREKTENPDKTEITESKHESSINIEPAYENQGSSEPISSQTVRIKISKLEPLLLQAEELIQAKKAINQRIKELQEINIWFAGMRAELSKWKRIRSSFTEALWNEWYEDNESYLNKLENQLSGLSLYMGKDKYSLDSLVENHLESMRQVLMLPVLSIVEAFPGMVREISREQNKEIEFIIKGEELEIDKRILEELKDPLIHLIRNSIDHGIEYPEERSLAGKPSKGVINLAFVARESGMIEITLSDDGKGIDLDRVLKAAIKSGKLSKSEAEKLSPKEIVLLIYKSGVSSSTIITDISGNGIGLSIVHEKVLKLNGTISVETVWGKGTSFHLLLPMTIATFRGISVRINEFLFILPTMNVERVMKIEPGEIRSIENKETIMFENHILPVVDLGDTLGLPEHKHFGLTNTKTENGCPEYISLVVVLFDEQRIALRVDEVVDEQQVLVKGLGKLLKRVKNISGATILGTGNVVPVINITDLIKSAISERKLKPEILPENNLDKKTSQILVVEDSITSRTVIKSILEKAGYQVTTSVDGEDAYLKAREGEFNIIVSDVDMPRMNGFELTSKIRHNKKLREVPVVLVTALGSREDRERGVEVGADAYIVKSNFNQNTLLEIVRKLI